MKSERKISSNKLLLAVTLLMSVGFSSLVNAQEHRAGIFKSVIGPNGATVVRPGDRVTATVSVQNFDDFGDSHTITNLTDMIFHGDGVESSGNLLAGTNRVTLFRVIVNPNAGPPFILQTNVLTGPGSLTLFSSNKLFGGGDFLTVTHSYNVRSADANLTILPDIAMAMGSDNHDGGNTPNPEAQALALSIEAQIDVVVGAIGDFVWDDRNHDGRQSLGEPGYPGVTVLLQDCASTVLGATVTAQDGSYLFSDLPQGSYKVVFVAPTNYVFTLPNIGSDDLDSDADVGGITACINLLAGQTNRTVDAGLFRPTAAVGDFVWDDRNHDGRQTAGEPGMPGVTVLLQDCTGAVVGATVTGNDGKYLFSDLGAGSYRVVFVPLSGYIFTTPNVGVDDLDSDPDATGLVSCFTLVGGQTNLTVDAGLFQPLAAVGDFVWNDLNHDGRQTAGEPGIPGATVILQDCAGATVSATVTGADGKYLFSDIAPGNYRVRFNAPAGFVFTLPNIGPDDLDSDADTNGITACITVVASQTNLTMDAGLFQPAAVGDFVWNDLNRDGCQDLGETGIAGVTVTLQNCAGSVVTSTVTDSNGRYLFDGLAAGSYRVVFSKPSGYTFTLSRVVACGDDLDSDPDPATGITACFTLAAGQRNLNIDAGLFVSSGAVGDFVWNDLNHDGRQNPGEPGISGATVILQDCTGATLSATVTGADGKYLFNNLAPGNYRVRFNAPAGFIFSPSNVGTDDLDSDADTNGITVCFALAAGQVDLTWDAGLFAPSASVGDFVWNDVNRDGRQNAGEPGIPGVTVILQDCAGNTVSATVTGADGKYLFSDVAPGSYRVKFNAPAGLIFTLPNVGSDDLDSDADTNGLTACFTLAVGQVNLTLDAGLFTPPSAAVGDFVWNDINRDGRQNAGEPGIPGVTVILQDCAGNTVSATVTGADGKYLFSDVAPGSYRVKFNAPASLIFTLPNVGSDDLDSDADTNGLTACFTLAVGQVNLTLDAGLFQPAAVGDFVWNDLNRDGCQDVAEPGIPGVTVTLQNCSGTVVRSTVTDANGRYIFEGLAAGSYRVAFTKPSGYTYTLPRVAACGDDLDSDPDPATGITACFTLAAGQRNLNIDAGLFVPECGTIGDFVWQDGNCNGIQDSGEAGIANVQIYLTDCAGNILSVAFTDGSGHYQFVNLPAGDYRVVFLAPANTVFTPKVAGNPTRDSNADANGLTDCFTLAACETNLTVDAGLCPPRGECCIRDVTRAISDLEFNAGGSDHAMWIPGISTNLIFYPDPGQFRECPDGTATLTGRLVSLTNLNAGFDVSIVFSGRRTSPPSGSPKEDLDSEAYSDDGGPVDSDTWYYYTVFTGTLTGFGRYEGAVLTLTRSGPAFQIGVGANNKNVNFGASGWFDWTRQNQPDNGHFPSSGKGDINIDLGPCIPELTPQLQPQPRPVLNSLVRTSSGENQINVAGQMDKYYLVECSADLKAWRPLAITPNTNGMLTFRNQTGSSRCFYRVKMLP